MQAGGVSFRAGQMEPGEQHTGKRAQQLTGFLGVGVSERAVKVGVDSSTVNWIRLGI